MSEYTDLIAEARKTLEQHDRVHKNYSDRPLPKSGVAASLRALLQAVTVPTENEREQLVTVAMAALDREENWSRDPDNSGWVYDIQGGARSIIARGFRLPVPVEREKPKWKCESCSYPPPVGEGNPNMNQHARCSLCGNECWIPVEQDPREVAHIECDCVPDLGPSHCHLCGERVGHPVQWVDAHGVDWAELVRSKNRMIAELKDVAVPVEPEWEYGVEYEIGSARSVFTLAHSEEQARKWVDDSSIDTGLCRRIPAGEWQAVAPDEVTEGGAQ